MGRSRGCIIRKNTKELRESLMSLRYRWLVKEKGANCIVTNPEILKYMELREKSVEAWKDEGWIDCGANDDMFLAIAALANNTDLGQWLIVTDATGDRWVECEKIKRFLEAAEGYPVDVDWGTQGFYRCNDAGTLPGECADFIFHKCND